LNIWYIHHYGGGPDIGAYDRPYQLGRYWQQQGHSVTVFIAAFHHLLEKDQISERDFSVGGVRYIAVPARTYGKNGIERLGNIWDFSKNLYSIGRDIGAQAHAPDVIVASSPHPFTIFPARSLARHYGAKLVFEIRDIWPLSITEILGTSRLHPFVQMCGFAERFALKNADLVASVLPRANRYLSARGYGNKPFVWVPNGIGIKNEAKFPNNSTEGFSQAYEIVRNWKSQGKLVIIYTGSVGSPNGIDLIINAFMENINTDYGLIIAGKGDQLECLQKISNENQVRNVHFCGHIPKGSAEFLLTLADIGYAGLRNIPSLFGYGISPNKISDYLQAGLPVFLPIEPCGDPVSESGGGIARKAETPEAVWKGLEELLLMPQFERQALGAKGKAYIAREYDYDRIARRYVEAMDHC
jgi:glycosyltransferase involved in cell wall biosynthesis